MVYGKKRRRALAASVASVLGTAAIALAAVSFAAAPAAVAPAQGQGAQAGAQAAQEAAGPGPGGASYVEGAALVQPADGTSAQALAETLSGLGFVESASPSESGLVEVALAGGADPAEASAELARVEGAAFAQPDFYYAPGAISAAETRSAHGLDDPYASALWHLDAVDAYGGWEAADAAGVADRSVAVAVLDTGCNLAHEDLQGAVAAYYDATSSGAGSFSDLEYHGTHVAGIVAATAGNGKGVAGVGGNKVSVVPVKVFTGTQSESYTTSSLLAKGYAYVAENASRYNIRVASMSLGAMYASTKASAADQALITATEKARAAGVLSVTAAGNGGSDDPCFPSDWLSNGVSVIALDRAGTRADYSNYNAPGSRAKLLSAPGTEIVSAYGRSNTSYVTLSGTSMAVPVVAAAAALVSAADPSLTPLEVRDVLTSTADDLYTKGFDTQSGYGRVDVGAAVAKAAGPAREDKPGLDSATVTLSQASFSYDGSPKKPAVAVTLAGARLVQGTDYSVAYADNVHAGWASATVIGRGAYAGQEASCSFYIAPRSIAEAQVEGVADRIYTGAALTQSPSVTFGGAALVQGTDYTLAYKDNVYAGTATMYVNGKGDFTGSKAVAFRISAAPGTPVPARSIAPAEVYGVTNRSYTGLAQTQRPTVLVGSDALRLGTDYTLSYKGNVNAGTATMYVTGRGAYTGTKAVRFSIAKAANTLTVRTSSKSVSFASAKKAKRTLSNVISVAGGNGKVTFAKQFGSSSLSVNQSSGAVTVAKGAPRGIHTANVRVTATGDANHLAAVKTVAVRVVVA